MIDYLTDPIVNILVFGAILIGWSVAVIQTAFDTDADSPIDPDWPKRFAVTAIVAGACIPLDSGHSLWQLGLLRIA